MDDGWGLDAGKLSWWWWCEGWGLLFVLKWRWGDTSAGDLSQDWRSRNTHHHLCPSPIQH